MAHREVTRTVATLLTIALVTSLTLGCSDDDGAKESSVGDSTTTTTSTTSPTETVPGPDTTGDSDDTADEPIATEPTTPLFDFVDAAVAGHLLGAPAEATIDQLIALLGPPEFDTGWQPSECPPATEARTVAWNGLFAYFGYVDGQVLDGARLDSAEVDLADLPPVRLPDGVEWGMPIEDVATAVGATAIYDEAFDWWQIWVDGAGVAVQYLAGPEGVLDQVMLGYVPVCR